MEDIKRAASFIFLLAVFSVMLWVFISARPPPSNRTRRD